MRGDRTDDDDDDDDEEEEEVSEEVEGACSMRPAIVPLPMPDIFAAAATSAADFLPPAFKPALVVAADGPPATAAISAALRSSCQTSQL